MCTSNAIINFNLFTTDLLYSKYSCTLQLLISSFQNLMDSQLFGSISFALSIIIKCIHNK